MDIKYSDIPLPFISSFTHKPCKKAPKTLTPLSHARELNEVFRKTSTNTKIFIRKKSSNKFKPCISLTKKLLVKPLISAESWVLYRLEKSQFIEGKNENYQREIASLTKIMTCITAIYELNLKKRSFDEIVTISSQAASIEGTSAGLAKGEQLKVIDLLYGLMLPSGNDAAMALAEHIGSILSPDCDPVSTFVTRMNKYAKNFELDQTIFTNPHGMSTSLNLSTAQNVAVLTCQAMKNSYFQTIVSTKKYSCNLYSEGKSKKIEWINTNFLLDKGFSGVKTGNTPAAGACLCFCVKKKKKGVVGVLLACKSSEIRWSEAMRLLHYVNKCE